MSFFAEALPEQAQAFKPAVVSRLLKTELCRYYRTGCRNGQECVFAHSESELRQRPDFSKTCMCPAWLEGKCKKSSKECNYAHGEAELRKSIGSDEQWKRANCTVRRTHGNMKRNSTVESEASTVATTAEAHSFPSRGSSWKSSSSTDEASSACVSLSPRSAEADERDDARLLDASAGAGQMQGMMAGANFAQGWQAPVMVYCMPVMSPVVAQSAPWDKDVLPLLDYLLPADMGVVDRTTVAKMLLDSKPDCYEE